MPPRFLELDKIAFGKHVARANLAAPDIHIAQTTIANMTQYGLDCAAEPFCYFLWLEKARIHTPALPAIFDGSATSVVQGTS
jgi:hypothetical protein